LNFYSDIKSLNEKHKKIVEKFENYSFCLNLIIDEINKREIEIEVKLIYVLFIITKYENKLTQISEFLRKKNFSIF
jgi:DNA integrity scanning protein DisA with diadenylate cyclase activity